MIDELKPLGREEKLSALRILVADGRADGFTDCWFGLARLATRLVLGQELGYQTNYNLEKAGAIIGMECLETLLEAKVVEIYGVQSDLIRFPEWTPAPIPIPDTYGIGWA